jgi:hypothetical protein
MTRLALARTLVSGTMTLQGNSFTFTASGSGTATGDIVPEAKKLAIVAANSAAVIAARASIDKILAENSAVLTDVEITSLISNNLSTTVIVYRPLALSKIATTTDGVNYVLIKDTIIGAGDWVTVHNGINLKTKYHLTNNGYFQVGDPPGSVSTTLKTNDTTAAQVRYYKDVSNNCVCQVNVGAKCIIDNGVTFENYVDWTSALYNYGTCDNSGNIVNTAAGTQILVYTGGIFNNESVGTINNNGAGANINNYGGTFNNAGIINNLGDPTDKHLAAYVVNYYDGTFTNTGTINNNGYYASVANYYEFTDKKYDATFTNTGTINNNGYGSVVANYTSFTNKGTINNYGEGSVVSNLSSTNYIEFFFTGTFTNTGTINNIGNDSTVTNDSSSSFTNDGAIYNYNSTSSTTNSNPDAWTGTGTCCAGTDACPGTCSGT